MCHRSHVRWISFENVEARRIFPVCGGFATWSAVEKKPRSARQQIAWSRIIDAKPYYEGSAAERAAAAGGNPETFEA